MKLGLVETRHRVTASYGFRFATSLLRKVNTFAVVADRLTTFSPKFFSIVPVEFRYEDLLKFSVALGFGCRIVGVPCIRPQSKRVLFLEMMIRN